MATLQLKPWHRASLTLITALCVQGALAQDKAAPAAPAPKAAPAPAPAAAPSPAAAPAPAAAPMAAAPAAPAADAPKKRRHVSHRPRMGCIQLDDPWDNLCAIQKKAEVACADLPVGKRKARKATPVAGNPRRECVDSYMRNV